MRKMPAAPSLERVLPRHPLEIRDRLVPHENGCLLDPDFSKHDKRFSIILKPLLDVGFLALAGCHTTDVL